MIWIKNNSFLRHLIIIFFPLVVFSPSFSQRSAIKKFFTEAEYYFLYEDYNEALQFYLKVDTSPYTSANIKYKIGICYLLTDFDKEKAIPYLEQAVKNLTNDYSDGSFYEDKAPADAYFYLGRAYRINNQIDKAKESFIRYKTFLKVNDFDKIALANQAIASW